MTNKTKASINESAIDRAKYELHMRQKAAIDEAATKSWEEDAKTNPTPVNPHAYVYGFKACAKTILDNYHDYGLQSMEKYKDMVSANMRLGAENKRLREALEKIANYDYNTRVIAAYHIANEALKQQDDETF